ncbi:MAG: DUF4019 domain-containing protein [Usitatibacteraceae bacterium]
MKRFAAAVMMVLGFASTTSSLTWAGEEEDIAKGVAAAESWLAIVDAGKYGDSWERAASTMQKGITKPAWEKAVSGVRDQVGAVKSRILMKGDSAPKLAKLAVGDAIVIQFTTAFEKLAPTIETVTPFREQDGTWKVSGYYVKPAPTPPPTPAVNPTAKQDANS